MPIRTKMKKSIAVNIKSKEAIQSIQYLRAVRSFPVSRYQFCFFSLAPIDWAIFLQPVVKMGILMKRAIIFISLSSVSILCINKPVLFHKLLFSDLTENSVSERIANW